MDLSENSTSAKRRLEIISRFLLKISPAFFDYVHNIFNIIRYIDLNNLKSLFKKNYGKVLEIGCGKGYFADFFVERGDTYYGIDVDEEEISFFKKCKGAKKKPNQYNVVMGDATSLPFEDSSFDLVFCNCVIEHILNDELVIREAVRVLKQGGDMIFTFPTATYEPRFIKKLLFKHRWLRWLADPDFLHYFDFPTIQKAEDWYVCERWYHVRRGYTFDDVKLRLQKLGMHLETHFYFYTQPLVGVWEFCTFSRFNRLFPLSLLFFAPLMRLIGVTKHGTARDSQMLAVRAVLK